MAQNTGTLISSAIRPNDSLDPIASAFASEIKGGLHTVEDINTRNSIIIERREWGMLCYVTNESKTYQLKYDQSSTNITDNNNWVEFVGANGGGGSEWIDSVISIRYEQPSVSSNSDRYLAGTSTTDTLTGDWSSFTASVVLEWQDTEWIITEPTNGMSVRVDDEDNSIYRYEGNFPNGEWFEDKLGQVRYIDSSSLDGLSYQSTTPNLVSYLKDVIFLTNFSTPNIGTASMSINSIADVVIKKQSSTGLVDLEPGDIIDGITYNLIYNGTSFELIKNYTDTVDEYSLSVTDYETGLTFSDIDSIIFRGGSVRSNGSDIDSVSVTGASPKSVMVWIPAPSYVDYFTPSLFSGTVNRYVSKPDLNDYLTTGIPGEFGVGNWVPGNTNRTVFNTSSEITAFNDSEFACFDMNTTMTFTLYDEIGGVISSIEDFVINSVGSITSNGITINVTNFESDADRFKASVNGKIDISTLFPSGGRMTWNVRHDNGEGPGNGVSGVYSFTKSDVFNDRPSNQSNTSSTAKLNGDVVFDENVKVLKYFSGVAFFNLNSNFGVTVSNIDLLNQITYPTDKQIDGICSNMAITNTHDGHSDGSTGKLPITGWNTNWDISGLTYSFTATVNQSGQYIPGFINSTTNGISTAASSKVTSRIYDYGIADSEQSTSKLMLFDTTTNGTVTYNNNQIESELGRLSTSGVLTDGSATFNSNVNLPGDELQYIFGRIIYPQSNFNSFLPSNNVIVDYSNMPGSNKTFNVYTDLTSVGNATTPVSFNNYRWYVTSYGKNSTYSTAFGNGVFILNSNFTESDLHYDGINAVSGDEELVILVGIDSSGLNSTPDKFVFVSGDVSSYPGRSLPTTYNLNKSSESSKDIQFQFGTIPVSVKKVWLFIGYKNSVRGKNLRITNISLV